MILLGSEDVRNSVDPRNPAKGGNNRVCIFVV